MTAPTPEEFARHLHEGPTLVEFLTARIDEDEAVARAASRGPWEAWRRHDPTSITGDTFGVYSEWAGDVDDDVLSDSGLLPADATHIAAHDPARVLAQCAAYRSIVEDFETLHEDYRTTHDRTTEARRLQAAISLGHLAAIWADHADYNPDWRP